MLAAVGASFDCASAAEIQLVLGCGVPPDRIIYVRLSFQLIASF